MPITKKQLEQRRNYIGASDVAAIFGQSPWMTAWDLAKLKRGEIDPPEANEAMERGNRFEPIVLDYAEEVLGEKIKRNQRRVSKKVPRLASNCDAIVVSNNHPVEAKTTMAYDLYGDGESDVPVSVLFQVHAQMICTESDTSHVAVLLPNFELRFYNVYRSDSLALLIKKAIPLWWQHCVVEGNDPKSEFYESVLGIPNIDPTECSPSIRVIGEMEPQKRTVELPHDVYQQFLDSKKRKSEATADYNAARDKIKRLLEDAQYGLCGDDGVTFKQSVIHHKAKPARIEKRRTLRHKKNLKEVIDEE